MYQFGIPGPVFYYSNLDDKSRIRLKALDSGLSESYCGKKNVDPCLIFGSSKPTLLREEIVAASGRCRWMLFEEMGGDVCVWTIQLSKQSLGSPWNGTSSIMLGHGITPPGIETLTHQQTEITRFMLPCPFSPCS